MAKKSRKSRTRNRVADTSRQPNARPVQQKALPATAKVQVNAVATSSQPQSYDYVKSDLVRIAVIAGVLILALIIMSFIPALKS